MKPLIHPFTILRCWVCLWVGLWGSLGWAQVPAFKRFEERDGLPQSQVYRLHQDSLGSLWIATHGGLARLGPTGIQRVGPTGGLGSGLVMALQEDPSGALWVAQADGALCRVTGSQVRAFGSAEGLAEGSVLCLALDGEGRMLAGTRQGLRRQAPTGFLPLPLPGWEDLPVYTVLPVGPDLWLGGPRGRIARWRDGSLEDASLPGTSSAEVFRLVRSGDALWAMTRTGLYRRTHGVWTPWQHSALAPPASLNDLVATPEGDLLVALGAGGLLRVSSEGLLRAHWKTGFGLPLAGVKTALLDRQGVLWVGQDGEGLSALPLPGLRNVLGLTGQDLGPILGFAELEGGKVLAGGLRGLSLLGPDGTLLRTWASAPGLPTLEVWDLTSDGRGGAWAATFHGLVHWTRDGQLEPPRLADRQIFHVRLTENRLWVGTDVGLAILSAEGRLISHAPLPAEHPHPAVMDTLVEGSTVLAATAHGLYALTGDRLEPALRDAPFAAQRVSAMARDSAGRLWVGTAYHGLYLQEAGAWRQVSAAHGLPDDRIVSVGALRGGWMLVGHGQGLTLVAPDASMYTVHQGLGLPANEVNQGGWLQTASDRIWIGHVRGASFLDMGKGLPSLGPIAPRILEARWSGGQAYLPSDIDLPSRPGILELHLAFGPALSWAQPQCELRLGGQGGRWQPVEGGGVARLGDLSPGRDTLEIRARGPGGPWVYGPTLRFRVKPQWHQHWAGQVALAAGAIGLGLLGIAWRTRHLKARARELECSVEERTLSLEGRNRALARTHDRLKEALQGREILSHMIVHDLRSPLSSILFTAQVLRAELGESGNPDNDHLLGVLLAESQRLDDLLKRLLDFAKAESLAQAIQRKPTTPLEVLDGIRPVLQLKAQAHHLDFAFEVDPSLAQAALLADGPALQQALLNLFNNALKFTPEGGQVSLRARRDGKDLLLEVADNGRGMDAAQAGKVFKPFVQADLKDATTGWGLGLSIVQRLVEVHEGRIELETEPGKGATFRIWVPLLT